MLTLSLPHFHLIQSFTTRAAAEIEAGKLSEPAVIMSVEYGDWCPHFVIAQSTWVLVQDQLDNLRTRSSTV